ncbi:MAG: hypothetical protein NTZ33_06215 [Bacteroidetes bacterium]|nr:hypothetical protein [Bacteroidota bacterium]
MSIDKNLDNGSNMGGIAQYIYLAFHKDIKTWPTEPLAPTTIEDLGELTGDVVMNTGKRFFEMYLTDDTGDFKIEAVGETDGKSFVMHLTIFHPGLQKKILGFMNATKNENLAIIVVDNEGQQFLMGSPLRPAIFNGSPDANGTGKETSARRGMSFEFIFKCKNVYAYPGSIPLTPGI